MTQSPPATAGEAVDWNVIEGESRTLIYSLRQDGWRRGEPIMVNDIMVTVERDHRSASDISAVVKAILAALPTGADQ